MKHLILLLVSVINIQITQCNEHNHKYKNYEKVILWANKIGPYHNPQEMYPFYSIPICKPENSGELQTMSDRFGSNLEGNALIDSGIEIIYKKNVSSVVLCRISTIDLGIINELSNAVSNHYWYQMYIDDLPIWGMLGEMLSDSKNDRKDDLFLESTQRDPSHDHNHEKENAYIYTHKTFSIGFNKDQIIEVNLTSSDPVPLLFNTGEISFKYTVNWIPTTKSFYKRFDRYLDFKFFEHQVHWFSIFNSFMMVLFLVFLVFLILIKTLKSDCARYSAEIDDLEIEKVVEETGWKLVHGDVFRGPNFLLLLSAFIGTGCQLFVLMLCIITFSLVSTLYDTRGAMTSMCILAYVLTSPVAGYTSASHYKLYGGKFWKQCMALTVILFPGICSLILAVLNTLAIFYESSAAVPFSSILFLILIYAFLICPLVLGSTLLGRNLTVSSKFPCRVNKVIRPIPLLAWYLKRRYICLIGGILPFGAIFIEMYFVFAAFWNYKFYYVYSFMLLVFVILAIVNVCVSIVTTYFRLNCEDYRWKWQAFMTGAATAIYVYSYEIYYYFTKTQMIGFFQFCFYFGYSTIFAFVLFFICGTTSYIGANFFVYRLYLNIKGD